MIQTPPYIDIHNHRRSNSHALEIVNPDIKKNGTTDNYFSSGIHPWDIKNINLTKALIKLKQDLSLEKCLALGEVGIDRAIDTPIAEQINIFETQLELLSGNAKPVIIHAVRSWSDLMGIKKKTKVKTPWIYHGYTGNLQTAQQIIKQGDYLSFGHHILFNQRVQEVFKAVPLDRVFLETDDSQEKIENIYNKIGELSHICAEKIKEQLHLNFKKVFGL